MDRGLFDFLRRLLPERKVLDTSNAWALLFAGYGTSSSVSVSYENALTCPPVRGAVAVLAESVAQLPLILYRRGDDGSKERATEHPLYEITHDAPNDFTCSFEFRRDLQADLLLHGHGFAHIGRSRASGQVVELIRIDPTAVTPDENDAGEPLYFVTDKQGVRRQIDRADILHLRALCGRSPLHDIREAIGLSLVMEKHQALLFGNGARPAGMLRLKGRITPASLERLQADFAQKWSGAAGSGRTMILEDDAEFTPTMFNSVDLQFLELRRFQIAEISRALRIPIHLNGDWQRATWSNAEIAGQQFLSFTLLPWIKLWEGALRRSLLSPEERRDHYFEFLVDDLIRADIAARFEAYSKAVTNGLMSINEIRGLENRPPMPGGDELRVPMNTEPADQQEPVDAES
jgi:HK97 family phage portal protein